MRGPRWRRRRRCEEEHPRLVKDEFNILGNNLIFPA